MSWTFFDAQGRERIAPSTSLLHAIPFVFTGTIEVGTGSTRWYSSGSWTISQVRASVGTAPEGASLIVDVNKNETTIFTDQGNRPTIPDSQFTNLKDSLNVTVADGDYLTVDVDQIGSTIAGSNLVVQVMMRN